VQQLEFSDLDLDALEMGAELSWQDPVDDSCWAHGEIPKWRDFLGMFKNWRNMEKTVRWMVSFLG
jgi:hypothetical protein